MSMRDVIFQTDIFSDPSQVARSQRALGYFLDTLYKIDVDYLRDHPETPSIVRAGVHYKAEDYGGPEKWKSIPIVLADGLGDCEDLACWLAAEITVRKGIVTRPQWTVKKRGRFSLYHIIVPFQGKILDPSKLLGMGKPPGYRNPLDSYL